jgi:hypothetical protein
VYEADDPLLINHEEKTEIIDTTEIVIYEHDDEHL